MEEQSEKGEKDKISKNSIMPLYVFPRANYSNIMQLTRTDAFELRC